MGAPRRKDRMSLVGDVQVIFEDNGAKRLTAYLQALKVTKVSIGYQPPEGRVRYDSGITVAKLAAVHEFGGDDLPARSFIRPTIVRYQSAIGALAEGEIASRLERVVEGMLDPEKAAEQVAAAIGKFVVARTRERLTSASGWATALAPETVEAKDSAVPLEETGLLIQALSWRVTRGSTEIARGND